MRSLSLVGTVKGRRVQVFPVAWCPCCSASRLLLNPRLWPGWPEGEAPTTGECSACGWTISVTSRKPGPEAA